MCIRDSCDSCAILSKERTGALIVIERSTRLGDIIATGTLVDANPTAELSRNIFFKNSPLHDGAMVIRCLLYTSIWGRVAFIGMVIFQIIVACIPGEPLEIGAGYAFGALEGTIDVYKRQGYNRYYHKADEHSDQTVLGGAVSGRSQTEVVAQGSTDHHTQKASPAPTVDTISSLEGLYDGIETVRPSLSAILYTLLQKFQ